MWYSTRLGIQDFLLTVNDGACKFITCGGFTFLGAYSYESYSTQDNCSCTLEECSGCTVIDASTYGHITLIDDGSCEIVLGQCGDYDLNGDIGVSISDLFDFPSVCCNS